MGKKQKIDHFSSHDAITYIPNMPITNSYHSQPPFQVRLNSNHLLITEASVQEEHGIHTHKKKHESCSEHPIFLSFLQPSAKTPGACSYLCNHATARLGSAGARPGSVWLVTDAHQHGK